MYELKNNYVHEILFESTAELNRHINMAGFSEAYSSESCSRLLKLRDEMNILRTDLDRERPMRSLASEGCTAYYPYLREELRPLEIDFLRHYYANIDALITNAENVTGEWWTGETGGTPAGGLLARAVVEAVGRCRKHAKFVSYWCGSGRVYMAGPSVLPLEGRTRCNLLWAIQTYHRNAIGDFHRFGLSLEGRELWVNITSHYSDSETFEALLVRGDPVPSSWGNTIPNDSELDTMSEEELARREAERAEDAEREYERITAH
jgi:hypothetical protein